MNLVEAAKAKIQDQWSALAEITKQNQAKVLKAFQECRVGAHCFTDSTGYGYHDLGRCIENVYAVLKPKQLWLDRRSFPEPMQLISAYPY